MSWYSRCSWCGGPFNGGNCRHCTNVSFGDEFVRNPDPIANDETPNFSYPPSQPQTSSLYQFSCFHYGDPLEDGVRCQRCTYGRCGYYLREGFCSFCNSEAGNSFVYDSNPNSLNDHPNVFTHPPQPQYESYSCELCGNDSHYGYDCPPRFPLVYEQEPCYNQNFGDNYYPQNSPSFPQQYLNYEKCGGPHEDYQCQPWHQNYSELNPCYDSSNSYGFDQPSQYSIDHQPQEDLNQQSMDDNEFIKSSVENLVPNPSESGDTSNNDSECDLPASVTFYNPLFDANDDFTSSDDKSLSDEDVPEDNVKIYSNPLFEFDDEYISSDVNPLFDEVLEDIESYHDSEGDIIYFESLLIDDTIPNLPPEVFLDREPRSLEDEPDKDDLKNIFKVFDPGIWEKIFSPTYVKLPFEDRHYLSLTYVIRIFLPYFTYLEDSSLPLSFGSEDIIFDHGISAYSFYPLEPLAYESPMEVCSSTCFVLNIMMIWGEIAPDFEDSRARGFVHRSLDLQSLACLVSWNPIS
ncbi:hypothetical protein Tco_0270919 [Tanacetum coccineum]